jgi:hypothetical protein
MQLTLKTPRKTRGSSLQLQTVSGDCVHLLQEFGVRTNRLQFFFPQAAQFFLTEPTFQQELPEDVRQLRVP